LGLGTMARNRGLADHTASPAKLTGGPGKLCRAMGIVRAEHNGLDLLSASSPLQLRDDGAKAGEIEISKRIGIRHAADLPLRFHLAGHPCVSGPVSGRKSRQK
ncbi:MAG TPA: DNA-3-methyladenine glycosylase, partial [Acidobacteriaceae bacterium]